MKILKKDLKHDKLVLKLETPDDLWNLEKILEKEDKVSAKTFRRKTIRRGDKEIRAEKEKVWIKLEAEKIEFHKHTGQLRITGPIQEGSKDVSPGSYHTIVGEEGKVLTIEKEWKKWQIDEIKKSFIKAPKVLVCTMDDKNAYFYEIRERIKPLAEISSKAGGKMYGEGGFKEYFGEIRAYLKNKYEDVDKIVLAGPGFIKKDFHKTIESEEIKNKVMSANCSHVGKPGVQEVIKRRVIERVGKESRITEETKEVEKIMENLSKETGKVAYGEAEVRKAVEMGAVQKILITKTKTREFEDLLKQTEEKGGNTLIVSEEHEAGEKLKNLGGIAALLRYRIK